MSNSGTQRGGGYSNKHSSLTLNSVSSSKFCKRERERVSKGGRKRNESECMRERERERKDKVANSKDTEYCIANYICFMQQNHNFEISLKLWSYFCSTNLFITFSSLHNKNYYIRINFGNPYLILQIHNIECFWQPYL